MTRKNFVLEIGCGTDLRGCDATKAAVRAVSNAIHNGSLYVLDFVPDFDKVYVDVTVAVPYPETVRTEEVLQVLPVGQKSIQIVTGGQAAPYRGGEGDEILIATAVVRVSIEV